jgi:hypothetical protein
MMRFRGGGVGHKSTRDATNFFKKDRDQLDMRSAGVSEDEVMKEEVVPGEEVEIIDENEQDDYGYERSESGSENEMDDMPGDEANDYFGPEDDGGAVNPDMDELGYADL